MLWRAGQVENEDKNTVLTETAVPADTEGGNAAMTTDEVENLENVETSVRAAVLGKGDRILEREVDRSVANSLAKYDIGTSGRSSEMEDEDGIQDVPHWTCAFLHLSGTLLR